MRNQRARAAMPPFCALVALSFVAGFVELRHAATTQPRYYAHETVEDSHGVIAPWYRGRNGIGSIRCRASCLPAGWRST